MRAIIGPAVLLLVAAATSPPAANPLERCDISRPVDPEKATLDWQMNRLTCVLRESGVSAGGIATYRAALLSAQGRLTRQGERLPALLNAMRSAATAKPFDPRAFEIALRRYKAAQSAFALTAIDAEIRMFRSLAPGDQRIVAGLFTGASGVNLRLGFPVRVLPSSH